MGKKFRLFFGKGPHYGQNRVNYFLPSIQLIVQFIHKSKAHVELSRNMLFLKNFLKLTLLIQLWGTF